MPKPRLTFKPLFFPTLFTESSECPETLKSLWYFSPTLPGHSWDINAVIRVECVEVLPNLKTVDFHCFTGKPREAQVR